ncbi:MAG TPA: hypothetical protein DEB06_08965 [Phycisphaerales bacterium]|nr:hypothetical protein [Phycisphaerales bacterium]
MGAPTPVAPAITLLFAGGGTGGHLFPALAIAHELRALDPGARCVFVCSRRPIDARILSAAAEPFTPIPAQPFGLRPRVLARFVWNWGASVRASRTILRQERARAPAAVVSMGGFAAAPVVQAARAEGLPVALINLDAVPGKANRWIARHARLLLSAADAPSVPASWARLRPIVRASASPNADASECRRRLGLDPGRPTLLITGGSQGATTINRAVIEVFRRDPGPFTGWQALHQCGDADRDDLSRAYEAARIPARVVPFIERMGDAWGAADLAIGRAGAGTVGEVWASSVPCVFLPYPFHTDGHQARNARPLVDAGGAILCRDSVDPARTADDLAPALAPLLTDPNRRARMRASLRALGPADGAADAARRLLGLTRGDETHPHRARC